MILCDTKNQYELVLEENSVHCLCIENNAVFSEVVQSLWNQTNGNDGFFVLSDVDKILNISKKVVFITNPFAVNCNDKKIINKIYSDMSLIIQEQYLKDYFELNGQILTFLDTVMNAAPYALNGLVEPEIAGLLKLYDVKIQTDSENLLEHLIDYLRAISSICGIAVAVFLNLKQYFDAEELCQLYEFCFYEKISLIDITGYKSEKLNFEKHLVIDKDFCHIQL